MDNDVLAGDFLAMDDQFKVGSRLRIDIYDVVVDHHVQVSPNAEDSIELIDFSSMSEGWKPDTRVGGRFLVLADSEGDDKSESDEVAEDYGKVEVRTAAPAMTRDAEKPIAHRINVTQKKPRPWIMPWIGPIPKVNRTLTTLSDFIPDEWMLVSKRKKGKLARLPGRQPPPPKMSPTVSIQTVRRVRLKSLLMGQEEGLWFSEVVGSIAPGHAA